MHLRPKQMAQRAVSLVFAAATVMAAAGCGAKNTDSLREDRVPVVVATATRADLQRTRTYTGTVEGIRQATVYARIPETIVKIPLSEGDRVRAGAPIIYFDEEGPGSAVRQLRAVFEDAQRNAEKFDRLFQQGAVSEVERDARRTLLTVARADYESARDRAVLTAPIGGVVTELFARVGRQSGIGEPLAQIASVDTIRILIDASVYEAKELSKGQRVAVRSELDTTVASEGWVAEISAGADPKTRTVSVEVLAENRENRLLPGMFVRASVELENRAQVISVPRDALVYRESGLGAFTVRDSTAHFVQVTAGVESGPLVEVRSGLQDGDQVVVLGQNNLQEGTKVNPVPGQ